MGADGPATLILSFVLSLQLGLFSPASQSLHRLFTLPGNSLPLRSWATLQELLLHVPLGSSFGAQLVSKCAVISPSLDCKAHEDRSPEVQGLVHSRCLLNIC